MVSDPAADLTMRFFRFMEPIVMGLKMADTSPE